MMSPQDTQHLLSGLLKAPSSVGFLQRSLLGHALREQGYKAQLGEGVPTWAQLLQVSAQLSPEVSEEELKERFERAYPQGIRLEGRQLMWRAPHLTQKAQGTQEELSALKPALLTWARGRLSEARRAVLRGASPEHAARAHALSLLEGEVLSAHLSALHEPSLIKALKRLRVGELSPSFTSELGGCFYVRLASAQDLKTELPRAVTLPSISREETARGSRMLQGLRGVCGETSREALAGPTGRAFDASLRQELKALAKAGALHEESARAFGVSLQSPTPDEWPIALRAEALKRAQALKEASKENPPPSPWLHFEAPDALWLVEVRGTTSVSFKEVEAELRARRQRERLSSGEARLNLEQLWEELSPQLKVRSAEEGGFLSGEDAGDTSPLPSLIIEL